MKVQDVMTDQVICIGPEESVEVAARTLTRHNIGALPVCTANGKICGMLTDRDLVTRCMAAQQPMGTKVKDIMTKQVVSVQPDMDTETAAYLMGYRQIRRLPVTEAGKICGMISLGDLAAQPDSARGATDALVGIASNINRDECW